MPKLLNEKTEKKYNELNEIRRNLKKMSHEEIERYIKGESLNQILGKKYNHGMK